MDTKHHKTVYWNCCAGWIRRHSPSRCKALLKLFKLLWCGRLYLFILLKLHLHGGLLHVEGTLEILMVASNKYQKRRPAVLIHVLLLEPFWRSDPDQVTQRSLNALGIGPGPARQPGGREDDP